MSKKTLEMEKELKDNGWRPHQKHLDSSLWWAPSGHLYSGPRRAWQEMRKQKEEEAKTPKTELVTKLEALKKIIYFLDKPGVMDVDPDLIELLTWQNKLLLWLMQEKAKNTAIK
jgi:hypothetical protein